MLIGNEGEVMIGPVAGTCSMQTLEKSLFRMDPSRPPLGCPGTVFNTHIEWSNA